MSFFITAKQLNRKIEEYNKERAQMCDKLDNLEKKYALLLEKTPPSTAEFADRVADLEVKMAKLWAVLIKIDARGNDAPSKFARRTFGGRNL